MTWKSYLLEHAAMLEQWTLASVEDVPDSEFTAQPGGLTNHPAWVLGHLAFAMDNVTRMLGGTVKRDDAWADPFRPQTTPTPRRGDYPPRDELIHHFQDSASGLRNAVAETADAKFEEPSIEFIRPFFPKTGRWAAHVLLCECAFHTGQLSAWRRAKGMPSVFESEANRARMAPDALVV